MNLTAADLDDLEPDDHRPASQQIANVLRAVILTKRIGPGERLPSQLDLADRYGVARETIKTAPRILRDERLIVTRQGTGAFVRTSTEKPVGLRPHIEAAFERPHVSIDFAGFSGETLHGAMTEPLDKIRAGRLSPESITVRILIPDLSQTASVPAAASAEVDDGAVRRRAERIMRRHAESIVDEVNELADLGLIRTATAEIRHHRTAVLFKLYVINGDQAFFGFYPVVKHIVTIDRSPAAIYDVMGKDVPLFPYVAGDSDDPASLYVEQARGWFDSVWTTIAKTHHQ
ncbi:GntR family transcriptional regulator [Asanoa ishikariensis]|uniref:winged helix-turn-helix domain-containing protein n=1 Tax=Asanoa ishikariensis TaxID=137265 RepID=UPI00194FBAFE|nr:winged helix-turn-helix domain-containing protein [Asanoa ishikariensis]GIF68768.1 GntR family transcriptional regulator [Asanoa ishikariensis]